MGIGQLRGGAIVGDPQGTNEVQAQFREVGEIFSGDTAIIEHRVDVAQTAQLTGTCTVTTYVGQIDTFGLTNKGVFNLAAPVEQHANLTTDFPRYRRQMACELRTEELTRRCPALKSALEGLFLTGFEPSNVAGYLLNAAVSNKSYLE